MHIFQLEQSMPAHSGRYEFGMLGAWPEKLDALCVYSHASSEVAIKRPQKFQELLFSIH